VNLGDWVAGLVGGKKIQSRVDCADDGEKGCPTSAPAVPSVYNASGVLRPAP
jgi:hypothetical protein